MPDKKHFFDPLSMDDDDDESSTPMTMSATPKELETQFEDPKLFSDLGIDIGDSQPSIVEEAADAIHELLTQPSDEVQEPVTEDVSQVVAQPLADIAAEDSQQYASDIGSLSFNSQDPITNEAITTNLADMANPLPEPVVEMALNLTGTDIETTASAIPMPELIAAQADDSTYANQTKTASKFFSLVLSEYKFDVLVEEVLRGLMSTVDAQVGSILEFDAKNSEFFFRAAIGGAPDKVKSFRIPANKGIVGYVAESRESLLINELEDNEKQLKSISIAVGFEAKSCIAAPIIIANQLYGVVELFNKNGINYFDNRDVELLHEAIQWSSKVLEVRFFLAEIMRNKRSA